MRRIDELFLKYPFYGARRMALHLRHEGERIGPRRAARLMRLMGLQAIYRAPRTSAPHPEHRIYPYLLRGLAIERPNHVWCADITYIPVNRGFLYLVAIMDWASRYVLAWRLSNTLDASFCTDTLDEALARHGTPEIFNTDQGSQFTSFTFTGRLQAPGIRISMDGRGRCLDNIFGSIRDSYVFVIDCLERQEVGLWTSKVSRCGFRRRAGSGARRSRYCRAGARARHRRQRSSLVWTRPGAVRIARAKGRFRAVWRGVCGATSARAAAGPSTR